MNSPAIQKCNEYSFAYGILCFAVVYMHLNIVPGGFDIYPQIFNTNVSTSIIHTLFSWVVPIFFTFWGYLSGKYLTDGKNALGFLIGKISHFWPMYIFFSSPILFKGIIYNGLKSIFPIQNTLLNLTGFGEYFGTHIMFGLLFSIGTVFLYKLLSLKPIFFHGFSLFLLLISPFISFKSSIICEAFSFYSSFCFGTSLFCFNFFNSVNSRDKKIRIVLIFLGIVTFFINIFFPESFFCAFPNSPGYIISGAFGGLTLITLSRVLHYHIASFFWNLICRVGNAAFAHLIIHLHIMNIIVTIGSKLALNEILIQILLLTLTSLVSIFIVYYSYIKITRYITNVFYVAFRKSDYLLSDRCKKKVE